MWKKLASMIAGSILVSSCQTAMYKPIVCEPGTALKDGRCQKVAKNGKRVRAPNVAQTTRTPPKQFVPLNPAAPPGARQNVYGLPLEE